jgi:hypothetical protein
MLITPAHHKAAPPPGKSAGARSVPAVRRLPKKLKGGCFSKKFLMILNSVPR